MPLTPPQKNRLVILVFDAFSIDEIRMTLSLEMGLNLGDLVSENKVPKVLVFELCEALVRRGLEGSFIDVVIKARPNRKDIQTECPGMLLTLDFKPQSTAEAASDLSEKLTQVQRLLDDPQVRTEAEKAKGLLTGITGTIAKLEAYKLLHDQLHILQGNTTSLELAVAGMAHGLADSVVIIRGTVNQCAPFVAKLPALVQPMETLWLTTLKRVAERLERADARYSAAVEETGKTAARNGAADALIEVRSMLLSEPSRIDGLIREAASGLKLEGLSGLFQAVERASNPQGSAKQNMAAAQVNAGRVQGSLKSRVNRHEGWQTVMRNITQARETLASIVPVVVPPGADESQIFTSQDLPLATAKADFDGVWKGIVDLVMQLQAMAPDAKRSKAAADSMTSVADAREQEAWAKAAEGAATFGQVCGEEFLVADAELKTAAAEVAEVGASIDTILRSLEIP